MSNTKIKAQARERRQRRQERSVSAAAGWSVFVVFLAVVVIAWVEVSTPGSSLRDFWQLVFVNGQVSTTSPLYQRFYGDLVRQDIFLVTPVSLLLGGLAFGRLCPHYMPRARAIGLAAAIAAAVILACILFMWGLILHIQHGHLRDGEVDTELAVVQTVAAIPWTLIYILGVWLGLFWRDAGRRLPATPPETV